MAKTSKPKSAQAVAKKTVSSRPKPPQTPEKSKEEPAPSLKAKPVLSELAAPRQIAKPPVPIVPLVRLAEETPEGIGEQDGRPPSLSELPKTVPLNVTIQTSQGHAANGNTQPANLLVVVTSSGWPVTELDQNHFTLMQHFDVPGQAAPFSNNIVSFRNAGSGAYLLQTRPINGASWRSGHHLGQLLVSSATDQQGQAAFKLIIR